MATKPVRPQVSHSPDGEPVDDLSIEYPSSDGEPMVESDFQYIPLTETVSTLRVRFTGRTDVYIAGDMMVYYRMNAPAYSVAPDLYAVFGATGNHRRDSWIVWREGKAPDFVMEIASEGTWRRDVGAKRDIYAEMGVPEYWRFDPTGRWFTPALAGERLVNGEYQPISVAEGPAGELRGYSEVLGLEFRVEVGLELRLYDPATGERLRNHLEETEARQSAEAERRAVEAHLQEEAQARQSAEAEVRRLRALLGDP